MLHCFVALTKRSETFGEFLYFCDLKSTVERVRLQKTWKGDTPHMAFNILVVDDSSTMRTLIIKTLEVAEIPINEVHQAGNGQEGLDILADNWIDLIFVDINMPVMNGIEMVDKMAEDGMTKTIPVIIISTEGSKEHIMHLKSKGISAYLRKPFKPEQLRAIVEDLMGEQKED